MQGAAGAAGAAGAGGGASSSSSDSDSNSDGSDDGPSIFIDHIEDWEEKAITGKGPGPNVPLKEVRHNLVSKTRLRKKYVGMKFLEKNPLEEDLDGDAVQDEDDWEHRVLTCLVWEARKGWKVQTKFHKARVGDTDAKQGLQPYFINDSLHTMIRDSANNGGKVMQSAQHYVVIEK